MHWPPLVEGSFLRRENRFRATVEVAGQIVPAHVPSPGRMAELLTPRRPVWLAPLNHPPRKTLYDLLLVAHAGVLVSVDSRRPNGLVVEAIAAGRLFPGYEQLEQEVFSGASRLDLRLAGPAGVCWVEVKSVNLVEDGLALFPDAPTVRGRRHLEELARLAQAGQRAVALFVVQREDAQAFAPHQRLDPAFAHALRQAHQAGVEVRAYGCRVTLQEIVLAEELPVEI